MSKGKVILIECKSSSINYIEDCRNMGYEPILMELYVPEEKKAESRLIHDEAFRILDLKDIPEIIEASPSYDETLEILKKLNPVAVIPCQDIAVDWGTRLAYDLGLPGNNPILIPMMREKSLSQEALAKHGIRAIRGRIVKSCDEAIAFYKEIGCKPVVVKPDSGAGSRGVYICQTEAEIIEGFKLNASGINFTTAASEEILIQEYIDGIEYIVNSVTYHGTHKITGILLCSKVLVPGKARIYDTEETVPMDSPLVRELIDYAFRVNDAVGVEIGPVHSEIMVDEDGPVLIEANFRPCGANMRGTWVKKVFGNRETDISLLAYLEPEKFLADTRKVLVDGQYQGILKFIKIDRDLNVKRPLFEEKLRNLPGFCYAQDKGKNRTYPTTIDLTTSGGTIALVDKSFDIIMNSANIIKDIERNGIESLFELDE